tara:strand:- start:3558 stop:4226 length:669 start_codon:yes stop_codon:yes gene_type:complete
MANEPKMEDFSTITKWLDALKKYGDAERGAKASNNISSSLKNPSRNTKPDPKKYDSSTQYTRFKTGAPINPIKDDPNWKTYSKNEKNKKWDKYRKKMRDWTDTQKRAGTVRQQDEYGYYSLIDRAEAGTLLGNLSNDQLARRLARSRVKNKHRIEEEFEKRSKDNPRLYEMLKEEQNKEAERDKSKDLVVRNKKSGGKVKNYGYMGGGKVYGQPRKANYKAG